MAGLRMDPYHGTVVLLESDWWTLPNRGNIKYADRYGAALWPIGTVNIQERLLNLPLVCKLAEHIYLDRFIYIYINMRIPYVLTDYILNGLFKTNRYDILIYFHY